MEKFGLIPVERPEDIKERQRMERRGRDEHDNSVEAAANWVMLMLEKSKSYSEQIPLKRDGSFDIIQDATELPIDTAQLVRSAYRMEYSRNGLYDLTKEISQKHPELRFSFKIDRQGKWIEYTTQKIDLAVGDEVMWENNGSVQWDEPKKIKDIQEDPKSKRKFAFVEGGTSGIPLEELTPVQEK